MTYSSVNSFSEPSFSYVVQRRSNTVGPNKLVDVETLFLHDLILALNLFIHDKHLFRITSSVHDFPDQNNGAT
jgi:hypothetical protein